MRPSTDTLCTSRARTPVLSRGLPSSSLGPQWPGLEMSPDFEAGARPAGAPGDDEGAQEDDDMADVLDFFT